MLSLRASSASERRVADRTGLLDMLRVASQQPRRLRQMHDRSTTDRNRPSGNAICGPCSGVVVDYFCRRCGQAGRLYADGQCARCVLAQRLNDLLTDDHGDIHPQLGPLLKAMTAVEHPVSILGWLRKSESATLLARLAETKEPITHQTLDGLSPSRSVYYVRDVLVHIGIIEERNEFLERIPPWLDQLLAGQPTAHAHLVRQFAHWYVLRRARRRAGIRPFTAASSAVARRLIRNASTC
jgi:hypothetical protein